MGKWLWTIIEVEPNDWWIVDAVSGTAFSATPAQGERLWKSHELRELSIMSALNNSSPVKDSTFVDLSFMGSHTRYLCESNDIADSIRSLYSGMISKLRRSPDVLVRVSAKADLDRLHRSLDSERVGVELFEISEGNWVAGTSLLPIIPPMQITAFRGRFCGLHAGLIRAHSGEGVIVAGAQNTGKTSTTLLAARHGLGTVLADELVLLDETGEAFGVPLPLRERKSDGRIATPLIKPDNDSGRAFVSIVIILQSTQGPAEWKTIKGVEKRLRFTSPHVRPLDDPLGRATRCVLGMLRNADFWVWKIRPWPDLPNDLEHGLRSVLQH